MVLKHSEDLTDTEVRPNGQPLDDTDTIMLEDHLTAIDQQARMVFFGDTRELTKNAADIVKAESTDQIERSITVIVPAYNAAATLGDCLQAIRKLSHPIKEIIVYIDGATDNTELIARTAGANIIVNSGKPIGPGGGRNEAAAVASGEFVLFVDADVIVEPSSLGLLIADIDTNGAVAAFGSYDTSPRSSRVASFYANLRHHHFHQHSSRNASTFWTGMGLIRRDIFLNSGGFDIEKYRHPSIEDVELGMRIVSQGYRIRLVPEALSKHCKDWTILNVWHTDIFRRAYPWSKLLIDGVGGAVDLNLGRKEHVIAVLALAIITFALLSLMQPALLFIVGIFSALYIYLNNSFFALLFRVLSFPKMIGAMLMHFCYHIYSPATFAFALGKQRLSYIYQKPTCTDA
jgi:glycosyltransferase involved in cell wall biosynthesis